MPRFPFERVVAVGEAMELSGKYIISPVFSERAKRRHLSKRYKVPGAGDWEKSIALH